MFNSPNRSVAYSAGGGGGIVGMSTFTTSGTWDKAAREADLGAKINRVIVEVQGGGGAGGAFKYVSGAYAAGSGGSGGYAKKLIDVSDISSSLVSVGAAGLGVALSDGGSGGTSIWDDGTNIITCTGGSGGLFGNGVVSIGGVGGTATGGDFNVDGQDGQQQAGMPGTSIYGQSGQDTAAGNSGSGSDIKGHAKGYGSGGIGKQGNNALTTGSSGPGADGSGGIVIVTEIA